MLLKLCSLFYCTNIYIFSLRCTQNPVPATAWNGILDAKHDKSNCIQKNYLVPNPVVEGDEDCLYLNVYRPTVCLICIVNK